MSILSEMSEVSRLKEALRNEKHNHRTTQERLKRNTEQLKALRKQYAAPKEAEIAERAIESLLEKHTEEEIRHRYEAFEEAFRRVSQSPKSYDDILSSLPVGLLRLAGIVPETRKELENLLARESGRALVALIRLQRLKGGGHWVEL